MRPPGVREAVQRRDAYAPHLRAVATLSIMAFALYLALVLRVLWRVGDEGSIVYGAQRVVEGAVPYRDFFEVIGPGAFYWLAAWFKVLGVSWLTSRLALAATAIASAWTLYQLGKERIRGRLAFAPAIIYSALTVPVWPAPSHHFESNLWVLLACLTLGRGEGLGSGGAVMVGLFLGGAATIMPQKGVLVLAAAVLVVLMGCAGGVRPGSGRRYVVGMVLTFGAVGAGVLAFFWYNGALSALVFANATWPLSQYHTVNELSYGFGAREWLIPNWTGVLRVVIPGPLLRIGTAAVGLPLFFVASLPVLALVAATQELTARSRGSVLYWLCGGALFLSEVHRPDIYHLVYGSPLLLIGVVAWLDAMRSGMPRRAIQLVVMCTLLIAAIVGLTAAAAQTSLETRRGSVRMLRADGALEFLQANTTPGEPVFVYPYYPMYYFLANVRNPTRYSILMYHMNTKPQFQEVLRDLERTQVQYVLWDSVVAGSKLRTWFPNYQEPAAGQQSVEQYLEQHYRLVETRNGFRILQRRHSDEEVGQIADPSRSLDRIASGWLSVDQGGQRISRLDVLRPEKSHPSSRLPD
jgi:hypothetical protein